MLPSNSTQLCQPLDVGVFAPFKKKLNNHICDFFEENPRAKLDPAELMPMVARSFVESFSEKNIINSFVKTGLYPYDPTAVQLPGIIKDKALKTKIKLMLDRKEQDVQREIELHRPKKRKALITFDTNEW